MTMGLRRNVPDRILDVEPPGVVTTSNWGVDGVADYLMQKYGPLPPPEGKPKAILTEELGDMARAKAAKRRKHA